MCNYVFANAPYKLQTIVFDSTGLSSFLCLGLPSLRPKHEGAIYPSGFVDDDTSGQAWKVDILATVPRAKRFTVQ